MKPAQRVLIYDDNGAHPAMQAAELLAEAGSAVEIATPERYFAPEIGGLNHAAMPRFSIGTACGSRSMRG